MDKHEQIDKMSYLSFYIRYSNSVFTETKYMELPKIFFGYFVILEKNVLRYTE